MEVKACLMPHKDTHSKICSKGFMAYLPCKFTISQNTIHHCNFFIQISKCCQKSPKQSQEGSARGYFQDSKWNCQHCLPHLSLTKTYILPFKAIISSLYKVDFLFHIKWPLTLQLRPNSSYYSPKAPAQALMHFCVWRWDSQEQGENKRERGLHVATVHRSTGIHDQGKGMERPGLPKTQRNAVQ